MSTDVTPQELEALCAALAAGQPIDSDLAKRARERSEELREKLFQQRGLIDVAVPLVREVRDGG